MQEEWQVMLNEVKAWAREAGEEQMRRFEKPMEVEHKTAAIDLVTEVDTWTENFLKEKIRKTYASHAIVTEESDRVEGSAGYEWVIDPIDGTVNYARGLPMFCISVALRHEGETVAGFVYAPRLGEMFEAVKSGGAYLNGEQIQVSGRTTLQEAVVGTGFPYDKGTHPDNNINYVAELLPNVGGLRRMGSAALDLSMVAAGRLDAYWELKLKDWDVAAGLLIVEEAGGKVKRQDEAQGIFVQVGTPGIFDELESRIQR
ncbi:myo-inositol-1(or 4)-monophosphatase [Salsuginibacillus halophilus]|uniref:Inositol-1-monophosphatase n=1 Tax=Salsuginibacillus halophilus TaxID=517424 RepID=A0A2P8HI49_9BACI|nr:inositol monophosphatase family protein [Salsuginibacillus halophilus]PSL45906.1 myo-inositol-1(or 4)-monophosphatase [Salsuginibacillus halophilus]